MRPALYYPWVYLKGGAERVLLELIRRSRHHWTLYTNRFEPESTFPEFAQLPVIQLSRVSVRRTIADVARAGLTLVTQRLDLSGHDALIVVSEGLGNLVAARSRIPTSCICLTPLKIAYDEVTRDRYFAARRRLHYRIAIELYARLERHAWTRYHRVFCFSLETCRRLLCARLVDESRLEVAHYGVDVQRFRPTGEREPFFLVPGRIVWTKNLELAIQAWSRFKPEPGASRFRLVVAGMVDEKSRGYLHRLRQLSTGREDIMFVESPDDDDLVRLYQRCHAVIFPSPNEDWGLVPLEAMACGKPVLATDRGGPRESVVDGETGFLRHDDPETFATAIAGLARMPAGALDTMGSKARKHGCQFGWDGFVERIDAHIEEIVLPVAPGLRDRQPTSVGSGVR